MDTFEQILEQYEPMITSLLRKTNVYKNHDHFRQSARIALWQAWQKYDSSRGDFAPYAYRTIQTTIFTELSKDTRYTERQIPYEKDKLASIAEYAGQFERANEMIERIESLQEKITTDEFRFLEELYVYGFRYDELSKKYGATVASLKKRRQRIVQRLRKEPT